MKEVDKYRIVRCEFIDDYDINESVRSDISARFSHFFVLARYKEQIEEGRKSKQEQLDKVPIKIVMGFQNQVEEVLKLGWEPLGNIYKVGNEFFREFVKYKE